MSSKLFKEHKHTHAIHTGAHTKAHSHECINTHTQTLHFTGLGELTKGLYGRMREERGEEGTAMGETGGPWGRRDGRGGGGRGGDGHGGGGESRF